MDISASPYRQAIGAGASDSQVFVNYQLISSEINSPNVRGEIDCIARRSVKNRLPQGTWSVVIPIRDCDCSRWRLGRAQ